MKFTSKWHWIQVIQPEKYLLERYSVTFLSMLYCISVLFHFSQKQNLLEVLALVDTLV